MNSIADSLAAPGKPTPSETEHSPYRLIAIAASAGGVQALGEVLSGLPAGFPVPLAIVQHRSAVGTSHLHEVLQRHTRLRVKVAEDGERLRPGHVYLAPADRHLSVLKNGSFSLAGGHRIRHVLSSANPLFESAAAAFGRRVIAVVLTGSASDGADGVQSVKRAGGMVIAQDEATSVYFGRTGCVDRVLPLDQIGPVIAELCGAS